VRSGLLVPISNNALGIALIITLIIGAIYLVFYIIESASNSSAKNALESSFLSPPSSSRKMDLFGLPSPAGGLFDERCIDSERGYIIAKTTGQLAMAICSHAKLEFLRFCFAIDFSKIGAFQAISYIKVADESHMIKITAETSMFSTERIRFYECNAGALKALHSMTFVVQVGDDEVYPTPEEREAIRSSIEYLLNFDEQTKKKFLDHSDLQRKIFS
jgi:hypothetical protein